MIAAIFFAKTKIELDALAAGDVLDRHLAERRRLVASEVRKVERGGALWGRLHRRPVRWPPSAPRGSLIFHQDFYDVSDAKCRLPADLRRPGPKRSASAPRSQLEQRRADADGWRIKLGGLG